MCNSPPSFQHLSFGDHVCGIYNSTEDLETTIRTFITNGVRENQRIICVLDTQTEQRIINILTNNNINLLIKTKQLIFLQPGDTYLEGGKFDPDRLVKLVEGNIALGKADGWRGVRAVGDMSWIVQNSTSMDTVLRYENMLNAMYTKNDAIGLCQYDRRLFEPSALLNVLSTHPMTCIGVNLFENLYFIPDQLKKDFSAQPDATLDRWIKNLIERQRADHAMVKAKEEAQAESKAKSMLLSTIFHDLRCPLIGITGSIEMLRHFIQLQREQSHETVTVTSTTKSLERDFEDCFKTMQVCSDHLLQVVNGILDFSGASATSFDPTEFSLYTCLDDTLRVVESKALEKDIGISVVLDDVAGPYSNRADSVSPRLVARVVASLTQPRKMILTDEGALRKVLINVINNAVKFTNRRGNIQVSVSARPFGVVEMDFVPPSKLLILKQKLLSNHSCHSTSPVSPMTQALVLPNWQPPSRVLFQIKDDGIGISPNDLSRIFEAFQRVKDARDSLGQIVEGSGLGLSIVRTLANLMGGDVSVESPGIGCGSVFSVWIPAYFVEYNNVTCTETDATAGLRLDKLGTSPLLSTTTSPITPQHPLSAPSQNPAFVPSTLLGASPYQETPDISILRYLVCDDNKINFQMMTKFLNSYGCKDVTVCYDGQSAVKLVRQTVECKDDGGEDDLRDDPDDEAESLLNGSTVKISTSETGRRSAGKILKRYTKGTSDDSNPYQKLDDDGELKESEQDSQQVEERKSPANRIESSSSENCPLGDSLFPGSSCTLYSPLPSESISSPVDCVRTNTRRQSRRRSKPFDIIFVDYRMPPGINGAETCRLIRTMIRESQNLSPPSSIPRPSTTVFPPTPARTVPIHQPVIVCLTAAALEDEGADCLASGINETLLKPLKRDFLEKRLRVYARWLAVRHTTFENSEARMQ